MLDSLYHALDPVMFSIGPLEIRWYGIAYILGFLFASILIKRIARRWKLRFSLDALLTIVCCTIVGVIVGARHGFCLFYGNGYYFAHPLEIFAFHQGGMSFHGGLVGALITGIIAAKLTNIPYLTLADLGVIVAPIGLFLGRCANFINGELWGDVTDLPWGVIFGGQAGLLPRHPSQLYEAILEGIILFIILFSLSRKLPPYPRGTFLSIFLLLYGVFRFIVEFVRQPDIQIGYLMGNWLTMGQVLSLPLIIAGVAVLIFSIKHKLPQQGLCS